MQNLQIISSSTTVQAQQIINGNTVNYVWNYQKDSLPQAISFNAQRGEKSLENFTGNNVITGAFYLETEKFDVQNNKFENGDFELYSEIMTTCKGIISEVTAE